jgi:hypothetical protein
VVDANLVVNRPAGRTSGAVANRVAECTVGDETGVIVLIAKNEQGAFSDLDLCCHSGSIIKALCHSPYLYRLALAMCA